MTFRKSVLNDVKDIINIISQAQKYFKNNNIDQWQNGYPNNESIETDISYGESYVLCDKDKKIAGTCALSFRGEKNYLVIENGNWKKDIPYAVIHRIAVEESVKGKGIASIIMKEAEKICLEKGIKSIRIDTHRDNKSMQKLILKNGFEYCGIIYLPDGAERLAYEKLL